MREDQLLEEIRKEVKRGVGLKKIRQLQEVSSQSVGIQESRRLARMKNPNIIGSIHPSSGKNQGSMAYGGIDNKHDSRCPGNDGYKGWVKQRSLHF
ncbi:hypothetical protein [Gracilibacillus alcaliphilus]|uniref:hypothetical protein n=1 Tax=Gracilibacillus alcaliphilus TaxID=1401441 RepID=UPI001958C971|nr:hypothetical protein [Gracilibacillus alcaliphilus]MBM7679235.1 hypothetical protein [Gracilibacillus alcaliphilus]